ncbi:MAG: hypothetical protein GPJ07_24360 [Microcystis aeruginosa G13-07]|nr:hypothetical protein [Microcystis aeruginosa G13-11]NCS09377.1 hypothetical protein [Microcystis aeruginosa G13-07]
MDLWYYLGDRIVEVPISLDLSNISDAEVAKKFIMSQPPENMVYVSLILDDE